MKKFGLVCNDLLPTNDAPISVVMKTMSTTVKTQYGSDIHTCMHAHMYTHTNAHTQCASAMELKVY